MDSNRERITDLEVRLAHLSRLVEQLNDVVATQNQQSLQQSRKLDRLLAEIRELKRKQADSESVPADDEKPPHY